MVTFSSTSRENDNYGYDNSILNSPAQTYKFLFYMVTSWHDVSSKHFLFQFDMFKQKPTISDGKANYVKLVFLNILFPTMFPLHPEKINGLEKNGPRKIYAKIHELIW